MIQLILESAPAASRTVDMREARQELESELAGLKLKALKQRAKASGVSQDELDDADDADDIKRVVIQLIVSAELDSTKSLSTDRPHHVGSANEASSAAAPSTTTKHVMLSYQWDHQSESVCDQVSRDHRRRQSAKRCGSRSGRPMLASEHGQRVGGGSAVHSGGSERTPLLA